MQTEARQPELEAPLTKRQLKRRRNKDSKLAKKFKSLDAEISNLKSQIENTITKSQMENKIAKASNKMTKDNKITKTSNKITKASKSTNARFKRKKRRSMEREADKITEKLRESQKALKLLEPNVPKDPISGVPLKQHPPNRNKCIEAKINNI